MQYWVRAAVAALTDVNNTVTVNAVPGSNSAIGVARLRDAETGVPKNKVILDALYSVAAWSFDAAGTHYGRYSYNAGNVSGVATANGNIDQVFATENYLDLEASYQAFEQLRLVLQVQNVFDKYPDKYVFGNRASGINPYSFIAPNGASGRFIDVIITYYLK